MKSVTFDMSDTSSLGPSAVCCETMKYTYFSALQCTAVRHTKHNSDSCCLTLNFTLLTTLRGECVSSFLPFTSGAERGSGRGVESRFRLTTSPEASRMMSVEGSEVMASPKIGESGDEDEVRVQMRYSAELDWLSSSSSGESGKICDSSKIITVCHYRHHSFTKGIV